MDIKLNEDERIDDLEFKNLKIIQNKNGFCFGIDAVLLSDFAKNIKNKLAAVAEKYQDEDLEKLEDKEDPDLEETQPKAQDEEEQEK